MIKNILILIVIIASISIDVSSADCCYKNINCPKSPPPNQLCDDCTEATPFCGNGPCNFFGCSCQLGCRRGNSNLWCWDSSKCTRSSFIELTQSFNNENKNNEQIIIELFKKYDLNNDKILNKEEFKQISAAFYPGQRIDNIINNEFIKLDKNNDNLIQIEEIDKDLKF